MSVGTSSSLPPSAPVERKRRGPPGTATRTSTRRSSSPAICLPVGTALGTKHGRPGAHQHVNYLPSYCAAPGWVWAKADPKEVWVKASLEPAEAASVVAHECRHLEQFATFGPCRTEKTRAARDRDANVYAEEFIARYLPAGRHGVGDETRAPRSASARQLPTFLLRGSRRVGGLSLDPGPLTPGMPWLTTMRA